MAHCFYAHQIYEILPEFIHFVENFFYKKEKFISFRACGFN